MAGYHSFKLGAQPVDQLVKPGLVLAPDIALSDERGVCGKDDALAHTTVPLATDLPVVELLGGEGKRRRDLANKPS